MGYFYYEDQAAFFQREMESQLQALAGIRVNQIMTWRQERLNDATLLSEDPIFAAEIQGWFAGQTPSSDKGNIIQRLESMEQGSYVAAALFDKQGVMRLSTPEIDPKLLPLISHFALESIHTENIVLSDLYRIPQTNQINMSLAIPLQFYQDDKKIIAGAVVYQIDPDYYLYPILQSSHTPFKTMEMLLVRREKKENEVLILNELRHVKGAPLKLRQPLTATQLPSVKAVRGEQGLVRGIDYRGVPVLAVNRLIPGSPWFLVVKIDTAEIFAPLRKRFNLTALLLMSLLASSGAGMAYFWRHRDMTKIKEKEKILLESEQQLRFLSSQLLLVQENERRRISKELHDELGLSLTVLKFQLSSIKANLAQGKKVEQDDFNSLFSYLDDVIENVRRLSWDLSPGSLEELGLATAVKNLLEEFGRHYDLHWSPGGLEEMNASFSHLAQVSIYRIFQESLTNIERHAQATEISLSIKKEGGFMTFTLKDNGRGFNLQEVKQREHREKGIGLTAMQERARLAGGSLTIDSQPGAGTKIAFSIPVNQEEAADGPALSHSAG